MASITKRIKANGEIIYDAAIKIRKYGVIVNREKKSFAKKKLAKDWGLRREVELQKQDIYKKREYLSVANVINQYLKEFPPTGRTKIFDLNKLVTRDIAKKNVHTLSNKDLIKHIRERNKNCQPQTAGNDLIWLNTVIKTMAGVIDIDTDLNIFESARIVLRKEGLIGKSIPRTRRPTKKELWRLSRYFADNHTAIPMLHLMWFSIYSARRQKEVTTLLWEDVDHNDKTCLLRDMKHPRIKNLSKPFKLQKSAYKIVMKQPKTNDIIFPYNAKTIGTYFSNACKILGIKDLHWHDLRHEATSRLFEMGLSIVEVQQVTLHASWNTLKRYANLKPGDLDI